MKYQTIFDFDPQTRAAVWQDLIKKIEDYITTLHQNRVTPKLELEKIRSLLNSLDYDAPLDPQDALEFTVNGLWEYQVHTPHPRYFGLFNPAPTIMSIVADSLVATFNPQLAAWSHNPFAVEVEKHLIHIIGQKFGYNQNEIDGTFTTGGTEANFTAILTAMARAFPDYVVHGLRELEKQPVLYTSSESHHSVLRSARISGLGIEAVREIPVNEHLQMDVEKLQEQITHDKKAGFAPFLVVATAGTTNAGVVDPISPVADIASNENLWLHVDAAWGGAVVFVPGFRDILQGIERADSITFDAHKWFSVPMGAGIFLTRHSRILEKTFTIQTDYMPKEASELQITDPFTHSVQWSRRFIGLKVFLSLVAAGWKGYAAVIQHQIEMGNFLRQELEKSGWKIVNTTPLPVICFVNKSNQYRHQEKDSQFFVSSIARKIIDSGEAWISTTHLNRTVPVLRACITNYRTDKEDIKVLVQLLDKTRAELLSSR
ncbi:MAG: pyridoxal phosphate-dependent decarboxylase family protein [Candidatus Odinarchaeota archaeon]